MNSLSNHAKQDPDKNIENNLADEIEEYPELKASYECLDRIQNFFSEHDVETLNCRIQTRSSKTVFLFWE